jgi:hypothetical protein
MVKSRAFTVGSHPAGRACGLVYVRTHRYQSLVIALRDVEVCLLDGFADGGRAFIEGFLPAFRNTDFAYGVAGLMTLTAIFVAIVAVFRHLAAVAALQGRRRQIAGFIAFEKTNESDGGADAHETQFARRFRDIDGAMNRPGLMSGALAHSWRRYRKTFVIGAAPPIRSSQRPNSFFYGAVSPPTWLGFAATTFVGVGLLFTFLGLVAALTFAAEGMRNSDPSGMLEAMRDLLAAAASKFVTSIAGVGLSIILNVIERVLTANLRKNVDALSSAVELGIRVDTEAHSAALADRLGRIADLMEGPAARRDPAA